jgi:hypothetical protein
VCAETREEEAMKYTQAIALKECYELWQLMSKPKTYKNFDWKNISRSYYAESSNKDTNLDHLKTVISEKISADLREYDGCPCCKYNDINNDRYCKKNCLIKWDNGHCIDGQYGTWSDSTNVLEACKHAKVILSLIEKTAKERKVKL